MKPNSLISVAVILIGSSVLPLAAMAADEVNVSRGIVETGEPLAVHGYDVVAYFTEHKPSRGSSKFDYVYQGATYRFSSEKNRGLFKAHPDQYAPQFGGFCAYGAALGKKFDGDPQDWTVVNDKLYLNLNDDIQDTFKKDVPGNLEKAEQNWKRIKSTPVASLK
jgi:YHS domain-containing protein